jgi:predicted ATP-grasp superfamily ATP-dependent carboligase
MPKLIENNARFTAANGLVAAAGADIAAFVYRRAVGLPQPPMNDFKIGLHVWDPVVDFLSFLQLRRMGKLGLFGWIRSLMCRQTFAFFRLTDPLPAVARGWKMLSMMLGKKKSARPVAAPVPPVEIGAVSTIPQDELMATEADAEVATA